MYYICYPGELRHHGIKGQKWGVRRYQDTDGSLTPAGRQRYGRSDERPTRTEKKLAKLSAKVDRTEGRQILREAKQAYRIQKYESKTQRLADKNRRNAARQDEEDFRDELKRRRSEARRERSEQRYQKAQGFYDRNKERYENTKARALKVTAAVQQKKEEIVRNERNKLLKKGAKAAAIGIAAFAGYKLYSAAKEENMGSHAGGQKPGISTVLKTAVNIGKRKTEGAIETLNEKIKTRRSEREDKPATAIGDLIETLTGKTRETRNEEKQRRSDAKNAAGLTSEEIQKRIDRLNLEKTLRSTTGATQDAGRAAAKEVIMKVGKTAATGIGIYALQALASGKLDREALGRSIFNGGPKK